MKILVGFEYSGIVRDALLAKGHDAISCDLLPTESPGPHHQGDIMDMLNEPWDMIIAHPPCTALCVAGNSTYGEGQAKYQERLGACRWTRELWDRCKEIADHVCFENPLGVLQRLAGFPKPQYIQPYQFGHLEQKKTGLFLHNLPPLIETNNVYQEMGRLPKRQRERIHYMGPSSDRAKLRAKTYTGVALAMADQWPGAAPTNAELF